jgi:hypothetical protein
MNLSPNIGNLQNIKTGDILTASVKSLPFILHKGVAVNKNNVITIYHNTPMYSNTFGGNIVSENINDWLKSRKIVHIKNSLISEKKLNEFLELNKYKKFNIMTFNCEHFVNLVKIGKSKSEQLRLWGILFTLIFLPKITQNR